jgi:hypothetical protein
MRLDPDLPAGGGEPDGGVPSVVYNPPSRPPRPPAEITAWTKARWWMYMGLTVIIGMALGGEPVPPADAPSRVGPYAESWAEGYAGGQIFGAGIGALLVTYALAGLFLGWSTRTRRFIPATALSFALLIFLGRLGNVEAAQEREAQLSMMQRWADSLGPAHFAEEDAPPRSTEGRLAWASRKTAEDMAEHVQARQQAHGFHPDTFPAAWGTAEYLANARKHPEIREYFRRQQAFLQELDSTEVTVLRDRMEFRLLQSGLPRLVVEDALLDMRATADSLSAEGRRRSTNHLALVTAGLEIHDFLVRVDARVRLDRENDVARFDRRSEHNRFIELGGRFDRLSEVVERQRLASRDRLRNVREAFGPPEDAARD